RDRWHRTERAFRPPGPLRCQAAGTRSRRDGFTGNPEKALGVLGGLGPLPHAIAVRLERRDHPAAPDGPDDTSVRHLVLPAVGTRVVDGEHGRTLAVFADPART